MLFDPWPRIGSSGEGNYINCMQPYYGEIAGTDLSDCVMLEKPVPSAIKAPLDKILEKRGQALAIRDVYSAGWVETPVALVREALRPTGGNALASVS